MNSPPLAQGSPPATQPRFDAKFIEDHQLIERYLERKLPLRGARELENWCRANPAYLDALKLGERAEATLKLLEESGRPLDLREPRTPWWKTPYAAGAAGVIVVLCLLAVWALAEKLWLLRAELADAQVRMHQGPLLPPATETSVRIAPDRAEGVDSARIAVNSNAPQLMDLRIDMSYLKATQFRLIVDKKDQGRALVLHNLLKDSNGELKLTVNTTGLSAGTYVVRIEALPSLSTASAVPCGWLLLDVH
jgi:hypothetical protein